MKKQTHQHLVALALAAVVMSVSLAILVWLVPSPNQMLAGSIGNELDEASPATVELHLAQLAAFQSDALPALVDAVGSERTDVSRGARRLLDAELDRWQALPPNVAARRVEFLARLLASHVPRYNATSREQARELVMRILEWPIDRQEIDRTQLIATCEIVLRTAGESIPPTLAIENLYQGKLEAASASPIRRESQDHDASRDSEDPGLTPDLLLDPANPPLIRPEIATPRPPVAEDRSRTANVSPPDAAQWSMRNRTFTQNRTPLASSPPTQRPPPRAFPPESDPFRAPLGVSRAALRSAATIAVMRWMLVDSAAAIAADELSDRGFSETQIQVARQFVDPDAQVRLDLAQSLPTIAGNDPRPWLLWLSRDVDPAVRRATVGILATSPDPALQQRLRELESEETDASVLRVVRHALQQRGRNF